VIYIRTSDELIRMTLFHKFAYHTTKSL